MNISVPDQLAEEVRQRDVPISAVCQRALRDEVARLRALETVEDITIVPSGQDFTDLQAWAPLPAGKPVLTYRHVSGHGHGPGWVLYHDLEQDPAGNPASRFIPGLPEDVHGALQLAREWLRHLGSPDKLEEITVDVGDPSLTIGFTGRWLLKDAPTQEEGDAYKRWDQSARWSVAVTKKARIAVLTSNEDGEDARLDDYDSLDQAAENVPADIIARAAIELGETRVLWRDI